MPQEPDIGWPIEPPSTACVKQEGRNARYSLENGLHRCLTAAIALDAFLMGDGLKDLPKAALQRCTRDVSYA